MAFRILEYPESGLIFAFFVIFKLRIPDTGYSSIQYPVSAGLKTSLSHRVRPERAARRGERSATRERERRAKRSRRRARRRRLRGVRRSGDTRRGRAARCRREARAGGPALEEDIGNERHER